MSGRHWTDDMKAILAENWPNPAPIRTWLHLLPGKSRNSVLGMAHRMGLPVRGKKRKPSFVQSWDCIETLLRDGKPRSVPEIAERTGFNASVCRKQMRDRIGNEVYVCEWRWEINKWVALFLLGANKPNARRPKPKTHAKVQAAYYKRMKKDPEAHEAHKLRRRMRDQKKKAAPAKTDFAASWLFNPL